MTIFQQFRLWARRAPIGERITALAGAAAALAVVSFLMVPASRPQNAGFGATNNQVGLGAGNSSNQTSASTSPLTTAGTNIGAAAAGVSGSANAGGTGTSSGSAPGTAQGAAPGTPGSSTPNGSTGQRPAAAQTCTQSLSPIKLGITLIDLSGAAANSIVNLPSPQQQQADYQAVMNSVNKSGGVLCHPLAGDFYDENPADPTAGQSACLQFVQDKVFAVLGDLAQGGGAGTGGDVCILQNRIPYFEDFDIPADLASKYYPYYFSPEGRLDIVYRNFAFAAAKLGYFGAGHGFASLGVVYEDCDPSIDAGFINDLNAAGVPSSKIVRYDLGCPADYASPSSLEQAVLTFKQDGVSTVTFDENADPDLPTFTKLAQQQSFKPQYVLADAGVLAVTNETSTGADPTNFNGAIAITPTQQGALSSPQVPLSAATGTCDKILTAAGLPPATSGDAFGGGACDFIWMFQAAAEHAPSLSGAELATGLQRVGSVPQAYADGPNTTTAPETTTLGQEWRPVAFTGSCNCWHVVSAAFNAPL